MLILWAFLMSVSEGLGLLAIKKIFFKQKKMRCGNVEQIPVLHKLSEKFAGKPSKYEQFTANKIVLGVRRLVNTTTFEHLVSGVCSSNSEIRKAMASGRFGKANLLALIK